MPYKDPEKRKQYKKKYDKRHNQTPERKEQLNKIIDDNARIIELK
jgi:heme oxygenase